MQLLSELGNKELLFYSFWFYSITFQLYTAKKTKKQYRYTSLPELDDEVGDKNVVKKIHLFVEMVIKKLDQVLRGCGCRPACIADQPTAVKIRHILRQRGRSPCKE